MVQDNLNTHTPASLYEAFPAAEARRLVERFEWVRQPLCATKKCLSFQSGGKLLSYQRNSLSVGFWEDSLMTPTRAIRRTRRWRGRRRAHASAFRGPGRQARRCRRRSARSDALRAGLGLKLGDGKSAPPIVVEYARRHGARRPASFDDKLERDCRALRFHVHHIDDGVRIVDKLDLVLHFATPVPSNTNYNVSRCRPQCYERRMESGAGSMRRASWWRALMRGPQNARHALMTDPVALRCISAAMALSDLPCVWFILRKLLSFLKRPDKRPQYRPHEQRWSN